MNKLQKLFIGITLGSATLAAASMAMADKYVENHYYGSSRYDDRGNRHDHKQHRERHDRHCRHDQRRVINNYYHEPAHRRVVVVERPYRYESQSYYSDHQPRGHVSGGEYRSATPTIIGGIIGGLAGHEMGKGRGKDVATVAGVILGGSIGRDMGHHY